ncbi:MAG: DUF1345 domain-containing protein [Ferruginibacter sp.]
MPAKQQNNKKKGNIFLRMHPLERILLSLGMSLITFLIIRNMHLNWVLDVTVLWDAFAFSFIVISWVVFFTRSVPEIVQQANKDDGSRLFVMVSILVTAFASMFTVLLLMISKEKAGGHQVLTVLLSIIGMILSWAMVHTIFTFHYAHMYYDQGKNDTPGGTGLEFPQEKKPDYIDFAYFAFVIGMTFQVSDVEINSRLIRRTALAHGLLAFALNTFVVALTINLVAGLNK